MFCLERRKEVAAFSRSVRLLARTCQEVGAREVFLLCTHVYECGFCGTDGFKYMGEMVSVLWSCCCRPSGMQYHVMKKTLKQNEA